MTWGVAAAEDTVMAELTVDDAMATEAEEDKTEEDTEAKKEEIDAEISGVLELSAVAETAELADSGITTEMLLRAPAELVWAITASSWAQT